MKKLSIAIVLLNIFISATTHTIKSHVHTDVQKQYDNLKALIHKADLEAFKAAFDELQSVEKRNVGLDLGQVVVEAKMAIDEEIKALGDTNKNWSKVIKGGLAKVGGLLSGILGAAGLIWLSDEIINRDTILPGRKLTFKVAMPVIIPTRALLYLITGELPLLWSTQLLTATAGTSLLYLAAAYKGLTSKTFKAGWNYKQYLHHQLVNLDAIAAHISQAHAYVVEDEIQPLAEHLVANSLL